MKYAKLTLMFLACAAAIPAFAQNTTDSRCGTTNFDRSRNIFTITNPSPATANQQCFITVVPKQSWSGGSPNLASSELVEGNYEITASGGGGAGGGGGSGGDKERGRNAAGGGTGGDGGWGAVPVTTTRYLAPGVYRMTLGTGGQGGQAGGGHGGDGGPTSLSNAYSGETMAGFTGAESWDGRYPHYAAADRGSSRGLMAFTGTPGKSGERGADGTSHASYRGAGEPGQQGGHGYIQLALKDPVPQAAPMSSSSQTVTSPPPAEFRPAKRDRN